MSSAAIKRRKKANDMTDEKVNLSGCLMTIFGATGDLTKRLLLPSIYNLVSAKVLPDSFRLLGVAREAWDDSQFQQHIATTLKQFWGPDVEEGVVEWLTRERSTSRETSTNQPPSMP